MSLIQPFPFRTARTVARAAARTALLALLVCGFALPAIAQSTSGIDEIVVTARKREESLQDTPLSVSALSAEMIEDLGISNTDDIANISPNTYVFQPPGGSTSLVVSMRGVSSAEPLLSVDSGVALYLDGAYLARGAASAFNIVDLERVEVLRGPQGTLYGRNATAGAINFITRQPREDFGLTQDFSVGRFGRFRSRTTLDTGDVDGLAATITYLHEERDGWINDLNAPDSIDPDAFRNNSVRVAVNWDVSEDLNIRYSYDQADYDGTKDYFHILGLSGGVANALRNGVQPTPLIQGPDLTNPATLANIGLLLAGDVTGFFTAGGTFAPQAPTSDYDENLVGGGIPRTIRQNEGITENEIIGQNLTLEYTVSPNLTFKSITTYREWENIVNGGDLGALGVLSTDNAYKLHACGHPSIADKTAGVASCEGAVEAALGVAYDDTNPVHLATFAQSVVPLQSPVEDSSLFTATNRRTHDQFSQELQLLGALEDVALSYVVGAYYFEEEGSERNPQEFLAATPWLDGDINTWEFIDFTGPEQTLQDDGVVQGGLSNFAYDASTESWALFGSVNWQPLERVSVSAGLRYSEDEKDLLLIGVNCGANIGLDPTDPENAAAFMACPTGKTDVAQTAEFDHVDYDLSVSYAVNDEINAYLRYATAYLAGGFNPRAAQIGVDFSFEEEELASLEAGVKALLLDNRLQLNSAVFYSKYENIQTQSFLAGTGGAGSVTNNAGEAEFYGVEVELLATPTDYLTLYLNAGYIDMEYNEFVVQDPGVALMAEDQITVVDGTVTQMPDGLPDAANPQPCADTRIPGCNRFFDGPIDLVTDVPGFAPPFSYRPEWTLAAGVEFHGALGNSGMEYSLRADVRHVDSIGDWTATPNCWPSGAPATPFAASGLGQSAGGSCSDFANPTRANLSENGFTVLDARITLSNIRITDERFASISLWGKNITDTEYIRSGIDFAGLGYGGVSYGEPATFGVDLNFEF